MEIFWSYIPSVCILPLLSEDIAVYVKLTFRKYPTKCQIQRNTKFDLNLEETSKNYQQLGLSRVCHAASAFCGDSEMRMKTEEVMRTQCETDQVVQLVVFHVLKAVSSCPMRRLPGATCDASSNNNCSAPCLSLSLSRKYLRALPSSVTALQGLPNVRRQYQHGHSDKAQDDIMFDAQHACARIWGTTYAVAAQQIAPVSPLDILTPDDTHIDRNISWPLKNLKNF
jgi:hypothetical protein